MAFILNKLLTLIILQQKVIYYLLVLFTGKGISPKATKPTSKNYRKLDVDAIPVIEVLNKLDYQKLLKDYQQKHNKVLKPINRRSNSKNSLPASLTCPRCNAPHSYIYDNNGGRGQYSCKICNLNFNSKNKYAKEVVIKCPHCNKVLDKIKVRKNFKVLKCRNNNCPYYLHKLNSMTKEETVLFNISPHKFKVRYIYRQFTYTYRPLSPVSPVIPVVDLSKIHASPHTLGLILTYYANYGLSSRKTAAIMKDIHNISITHQTVINYAEAVSRLIKYYVDTFPYKLSNSFCGDETYLKIKGKWQYLFFFFDAINKIILSYRISPERDALAAIKALDDTMQKIGSLPDDLTFVVDGNPIYRLAQHFFAEKGIYFDIKQVIGLTNKDKISAKYRPLKQIIERLNRTFKREYKTRLGFNSSAGSETFTILFVAYFNFLRPHSALEDKVPVVIPELNKLPNMPAKWLKLIDLAQTTLIEDTA